MSKIWLETSLKATYLERGLRFDLLDHGIRQRFIKLEFPVTHQPPIHRRKDTPAG